MRFSEFNYQRPDLENFREKFRGQIDKFISADDYNSQSAAILDINKLRNNFETMQTIAQIRHSIDTNNEFYEQEQNYYDENTPLYQELVSEYYKALINSKFREELEKAFGKQIFNLAELSIKTFSPDIIEELQLENKLSSEYTKLIASAKIFYDGHERNLSQLGSYMQSKDREIRKSSSEAKYTFLSDNGEKIDDIYDKLVKVRVKIAKKLGFNNYIELGYARLNRTDYNPEMVANFRDQVKKYIVPAAQKLKARQAKRIGIDSMKYYDEGLKFNSGNAKPEGTSEWIVNNAKKMYGELSKETGEYFDFMLDSGLMDLVSKKGKAGGGYCTYIADYKAPFIFSNFNGTSGDVEVLTHEAGHAFQVYSSRDYELPEYMLATLEACEIHSMSMEFFGWPWMELFFKENADKYRFTHLTEAVLFIPYGVAVDEFQHFVYQKPEASAQDRRKAWREIEKKYLPWRDYEGNKYLEEGGYWHQQGHIFGVPFYYIDYTLAQICAFQFWKKSNENREKAWSDYLRLCKAGGSMSFLKLVKLANLKSPFENGCIESVIDDIMCWLDKIDDMKM